MRAALIAGGLAMWAACHDLPDLGTCGNGIVEQAHGEACDDGGESATCTASCELKCTTSPVIASYVDVGRGKAAYCPDASYRCGIDGVCRAPSGAFQPLAALVPFDVATPPVISDVDNDGLVDLVGTSMTRISVGFGSTTGTPLGDVVSQDAPFSDAPYAIFDLPANRPADDQPGTMMAIPTEGIALLRSDGERFTPQLDLPFEIPRDIGVVTGIVVRDPDPAIGDVPIVVQSTSPTPSIALARVPVGLPPLPMQVLPPCVGRENQRWRTVDVKAAPDRQSFVVVTQRDDAAQPAAQPWHVCRYTYSGTSWALADVELPPPTPSSIALADLDGDSCLELVVHSDGAPGLAMLDATGAGCGFASTTTPLPIAGPGAALLGAGPIVPGGVDELVLADGVYRACTGPADCGASPAGTFVRVAGPTFPTLWSAAAITDLNGDDVLDVVAGRVRATAANPTATGEAAVDIVRGGAAPNVYTVTTSEPVTSLVAGDFDGDRLDDVAMIESAPPGGPGDRITVLFGTREATAGTPVAMSPFGGRLRIGRASDGDGTRTLQLFRTTGCPLQPLAIDALTGCVDVVNAGKGLIAICRDPGASASPGMNDPAARELIAVASAGGTFVATPLAPIDGDAHFVTAGDFDGDGVLDVAVGVHRGSGVGVQLLRQCPAHDTRACQSRPGSAAAAIRDDRPTVAP